MFMVLGTLDTFQIFVKVLLGFRYFSKFRSQDLNTRSEEIRFVGDLYEYVGIIFMFKMYWLCGFYGNLMEFGKSLM